MTTNAQQNQRILTDLTGLSTPEHFGMTLLRNILKVAAQHTDPTKPIEIPVTFRVYAASAGVVVDHGGEVCDEHILPSGTIIGHCIPRDVLV
ncbi:hypothetical protein GCM10009665_24150 [Kitasatospora nipponensis]|uniref:Uncharacterized protein n=1 Tax=Kitasatospora nipponensis TaxID=258049 RepID=A0ABN1W2S6_9ACTN